MANYIIIGGDNQEYGPVNETELRQWIAEGRLNGASRVKAESDAEFRTLSLFPEFAEALQPRTAAPGSGPVASEPAETAPVNWRADVLAREPELRFGECLAAGWSFLGANAGFLIPAVLLTSAANFVLALISVYVTLLGPLVLLCFIGVVMGGFYLACLRRQRGEAVSPLEVFSGFKVGFAQLLLAGLVSSLLTEVSVCCLILPAIYLAVAWVFALPLVADKKLFFWDAMELSRKVVTRVWFEAFVLLLIAFLPLLVYQAFNLVEAAKFYVRLYDESGQNFQQYIQSIPTHAEEIKKMTVQGTLIAQAVLLVNLFYCTGVIIRAYENLFGLRKP
jgi:hypothetical protein